MRKEFSDPGAEIAAKVKEILGRLAAALEFGKLQNEVLTDTAKIAVAVSSVRKALKSEHLAPVEKNQILSAVVATIKPNLDKNHVVLALRPFFTALGRKLYLRF